jgi:hypothetical protein
MTILQNYPPATLVMGVPPLFFFTSSLHLPYPLSLLRAIHLTLVLGLSSGNFESGWLRPPTPATPPTVTFISTAVTWV